MNARDGVRPASVVAVDIGGSGWRARWYVPGAADDGVRVTGGHSGVGPRGVSFESMAREVDAALRRDPAAAGMPGPGAVAIGASGLLTLADGGSLAGTHAALAAVWPGARLALASDALTSLLGALGGLGSGPSRGGVVVAAGTGVVGLGTDLGSAWHRVDGWGHILGDAGGGAWIGMRGLQSALRRADGRRGGSEELLRAGVGRFGPVDGWPRAVYTREDRVGLLASFVPDVAAAARGGDPEALRIWRTAGRHLADTALAAMVDGVPRRVLLVGGIRGGAADLIEGPFRDALAEAGAAAIEIPEPAGDALSGAGVIAEALLLAPETLPDRPPYLTLGAG